MKNNRILKLISLIICLFLCFSVVGCGQIYAPDLNPDLASSAPALSSTPSSASSDETTDIDKTLKVEFLDVGQADCSIVYLPDGKILLIDAGNRGDGEEILSYIKGCGI